MWVSSFLSLLLCSSMGMATNFFSLSATTLSGRTVQFSQYKGKVSKFYKYQQSASISGQVYMKQVYMKQVYMKQVYMKQSKRTVILKHHVVAQVALVVNV